jgi:hypothetical protein
MPKFQTTGTAIIRAATRMPIGTSVLVEMVTEPPPLPWLGGGGSW